MYSNLPNLYKNSGTYQGPAKSLQRNINICRVTKYKPQKSYMILKIFFKKNMERGGGREKKKVFNNYK